VGGFAAHDAEDLLTTLAYRNAGWRGVYVPRILARGLTPVDWSGYLSQQERWARSILDLKLRGHAALSSHLPLLTRLVSLVHGIHYLYRSFVIVALLLLLFFVLATGVGAALIPHLLVPQLLLPGLVLWVCDRYRQRFYLDRENECGIHWRVCLLQLGKWPCFLWAAFQVLINRRVPYTLTPKAGLSGRAVLLRAPLLLAAIAVSAAWGVGLLCGHPLTVPLQLGAGITVTGLLLLVATDLMRFPNPYDRTLVESAGATGFTNDQSGNDDLAATGRSGSSPAASGHAAAVFTHE
jgi:hypothetical protein